MDRGMIEQYRAVLKYCQLGSLFPCTHVSLCTKYILFASNASKRLGSFVHTSEH